MDIIWTLVCVLCSLLMFALGGYGTHVFLEGPKQGTDFEFNVLMVGLTPFFPVCWSVDPDNSDNLLRRYSNAHLSF